MTKVKENPYLPYPRSDGTGIFRWNHDLGLKSAEDIKAIISPVYKKAKFIMEDFKTRNDNKSAEPDTIYLYDDESFFIVYSLTDDWNNPDVPIPEPLSVTDQNAGIGILSGKRELNWPHLLYHNAEQVVECIKKCYPELDIRDLEEGMFATQDQRVNRLTLWKNRIGAVTTAPSAPWVEDKLIERYKNQNNDIF